MAVRRPITWLDVFTAVALTGNALAVVHDADGIDDETMLAFARETRLSETTFVQAATDQGADYRNRIFTMAGEIRFAGHPSLGTAVAIARAREQASASFTQQTTAGLQPVEVQLEGDTARASMLQEPPAFGPEVPAGEVMPVAGLNGADADPRLPPQVVSTGVPHLIAPVRANALQRAAPQRADLAGLLEPLGVIVLFLAAVDGDTGTVRARGFFLGPEGVIEDPATGSAAGPLLAHVREYTGTQALTVYQGDEIGRPSVIECSWEGDRPRVAGDVVVVADGHVSL